LFVSSSASGLDWARRLRAGLQAEIDALESNPHSDPATRTTLRQRLDQVERLVAAFDANRAQTQAQVEDTPDDMPPPNARGGNGGLRSAD
jgi:hypothetical protein